MSEAKPGPVVLSGYLCGEPAVFRDPSGGPAMTLVHLVKHTAWKVTNPALSADTRQRVVFFNRLTEHLQTAVRHPAVLRRGTKLYVEGHLHRCHWQDKQSQVQQVVLLLARALLVLNKRGTVTGVYQEGADPLTCARLPATLSNDAKEANLGDRLLRAVCFAHQGSCLQRAA